MLITIGKIPIFCMDQCLDGTKAPALSFSESIKVAWAPLSSVSSSQQAIIQFYKGNVRGGFVTSAWYQRPVLQKNSIILTRVRMRYALQRTFIKIKKMPHKRIAYGTSLKQ